MGNRCSVRPVTVSIGRIMPRTVPNVVALLVSTALAGVALGADGWKAGVAVTGITPEEPMWMSGYGSRDRPAEGTLHDLWAKALVLEDPSGSRAVLVSLDLVGIDRETSSSICETLKRRHGLERSGIALATSHTHTGPVVGHNLGAMYFLDAEGWERVRRYTAELEKRVAAVVGEAISSLAPCRLEWGNGQATFAVNRRNNPERDVPALRGAGKLVGPVDHDVPVLSIRGPDGTLRAVVFGYACHATVLSFYQWSGDYPGFAQRHLENDRPGAVALFFAGCGGDQNPLPRRSVELADEYGRRLAAAVDRVLDAPMAAIDGDLVTRYAEIPLPFDRIPSEEELEKDANNGANRYVKRRAQLLLDRLRDEGAIAPTYPYPVQLWRLGSGPRLVLLGGEVVVDYSLRLKRELGPESTWVAAYVNDVMAYIPSLRVLREGGYEGEGAMLYYGQPSRWDESVEERVVRAVLHLSHSAGHWSSARR